MFILCSYLFTVHLLNINELQKLAFQAQLATLAVSHKTLSKTASLPRRKDICMECHYLHIPCMHYFPSQHIARDTIHCKHHNIS